MGKAAIALVLATFLGAGALYLTRDQNMLSRQVEEAEYEAKVIAREAAQSAFNIVVSEVKKNYEGYRGSIQDQAFGKAKYDLSATDAADSGVLVSATGKYGNYEYEISGLVDRSGSRLIDALTIDGPIDDFEKSADALISGIDTKPDGTKGPGPNVHAVLTTTTSTFNLINNALSGIGGLLGLGSDGDELDIINEDPKISLDGLESAIRNFEGDALTTFDGAKTYNGGSFGSAGAPGVLRVNGNLKLKSSFTGYGILYVTGNLTIRNTASWNGLVFVNNPDGSSHNFRNSGSIYGALIVRSANNVGEPEPEDEEDRGLKGGHFDIDVFDEPNQTKEVYHQHKYDDEFNVKGVDLLSSGCGRSDGGGLCWNDVFGSGDIDRVKIEFKNTGYSLGTYKIRVGSDLYTGATTNGFSLEVDDVDDITEFKIDFLTLMALRGTEPSDVQDDPNDRDNSFTVVVTDLEPASGSSGDDDDDKGKKDDDDDDKGKKDDDDDKGDSCAWWESCGDDDDKGKKGKKDKKDDDDDDGRGGSGSWWDNDDDLNLSGFFSAFGSRDHGSSGDDDDDDGGCAWWQDCSGDDDDDDGGCEWWEDCSEEDDDSGSSGSGGGSSSPVLVYELAIYHHTKGWNGSGMDGGDGSAGDYDWSSDGDGDGENDGGEGTVEVCHIPPGNPANKHTIHVGMAAVDAHLGHGDQAGTCDNDVYTEEGDDIDIEFDDEASVVYSSAVLRPLKTLISQIEMVETEIVVSRTAEKPRMKVNADPIKK